MNDLRLFYFLILLSPHKKSIFSDPSVQTEIEFIENNDLKLILLETKDSALLWRPKGKEGILSMTNPELVFNVDSDKIFFSTPFIYNRRLNNVQLTLGEAINTGNRTVDNAIVDGIFKKIENLKNELKELMPGIESHFA